MGRKTKYSPDLCRQAEECMSQGMTLKQMSKAVGVHISKLCVYLNKYKDFVDAVERGRKVHIKKNYMEFLREYIQKKIGRKNRERCLKELEKLEKKHNL